MEERERNKAMTASIETHIKFKNWSQAKILACSRGRFPNRIVARPGRVGSEDAPVAHESPVREAEVLGQ